VLTPDCQHLHLTHSVGASDDVRATLEHASFDLPVCGEVAKSLKPLVIDNMQATTEPRYEVGRRCGYDAFAAFPVLEGQTLYGVMSFAARGRTQFEPECLEFFATIASHVAIVRGRRAREAALLELTQSLEARIEQRTAALLEAEDALRQAQKMEAVGQLTGGLAHDFNNLLVGITGSLELLQSRLLQGRLSDAERYIGAAQNSAKRAAALTHRLLAFSRRQTLEPRAVRLDELVRGMEELIRRTLGPNIALACSAVKGLWVTYADPGQLENALLNLCINARDAMPDGGRLVIDCANRVLAVQQAAVLGLEPGDYLCLSVQDSGAGMAPAVLNKAFDPFFTTKPIGQGTGLGLSMIYGFARQSHGQVKIRSQVGEGTEVSVYLPRHLGEPLVGETVLQPSTEPVVAAGLTVLVVDDEPTVRMLVTEVLGELGYHAVEAADGASGLEVLNSDMRIDLLVTDVGLPGGMNGRQMADAARVARPELKVLFITGYAESAVLNHGHLDPGMQVMTKPFGMEALSVRIAAMIKS
jgi:signal transduction histidine kinase/CheY-like chemotaxis protein